jgi:CDP-diacylglycerol---serine O-phosphatidyltransferase
MPIVGSNSMRLKIKREKIFFTITWLRWILAIIVAMSLLVDRTNIALFVFIITTFFGFFENFISKKYPSVLRPIVDFFADKLLVNLTAIMLTIKGVLPIWAMLIILSRDMLTIIGGTILLFKDLRREFKPTVLGKISYFFQLMALIPLLLNGQVDWYVMGSALVLTIISGVYSLFKSEFKLIKRKSDLDEFRLIKLLKVADIITLFNVAFGLASIIFSISNNFTVAAHLLLAAVVFDFLDGKVASIMKQQNHFGKELDSLADTVSFGVAPALFGFSLMQFSQNIQQFQITFGIIAFTVFIFCGILRLAKYNIMGQNNIFSGMPITMNGVFVPIIYFLGVPLRYYPYIFLVLGILMVSNLKIKKF